MVQKLVIIGILLICIIMVTTFYQNVTNFKTETIRTLVRQASRWSLAAIQDKNEMIAVLHANYGAGYLWAVRDIAKDNEIEKATGIDIIKFRDRINNVQDTATKRLAKLCPKYAPSDAYLAQIAENI